MKNKNIPLNTELPSMGKLIKSTILAICIATIILVTVVLPAEYGIDPTGVGNVIGLLKMGEIKVSLSEEASANKTIEQVQELGSIDNSKLKTDIAPSQSPLPDAVRSDKMTISLSPDEGKEIKLAMNKGAQVNYVWWTDGGRANFDCHADSKKLEIKYHNYTKGSDERSEGVLEAEFDGKHGWFWRNRTSEPLTVTLQVSGEYSSIDMMK